LRVQATNSRPRFEVTCDGEGVVSHAGAALLVELADRLELTAALSWRAGRGQTRRHRHDAGGVLRNLAVMLADGGDCLSDLAVLRDQPELFGPVASTATAWRVVEQVAADELGLAGLRAARAQARGRAWQAGAHADGLLLVDIDGTLVDAHSPKQGAAGTYKGGFGFYPLLAFLDRGNGTGEALAGLLRPGNAGSNTASDHIEVIDLALAQLPSATRDQPIVVRADTGGATHAFTGHLRERGVRFSISLPADERVRAAVLAVGEAAWQPAVGPDGQPRTGAEVAELAGLDLPAAGWPAGTRAICRREDPPPGCAAVVHRRRRAPLPGLHHRPARSRPGRAGAAASPARPGRRPHPLRQGHRASPPPLRPVAPQRCLARAGLDGLRPGLLGADPAAGRRARRGRAQDAAVSAVAYRRPGGPPRPPRHRAPATHLAVGGRAGRRVHSPASLAAAQLTPPPYRAASAGSPPWPACPTCPR
jgi:Transposase DDE domain group 1